MKYATRTDYTIEKIGEDTYKIVDFKMANCYLLIGDERALLIDVGIGVGDLKTTVENITALPYDVVCTHAHVDHIGGRGQFDKIYMHKADADTKWKKYASMFVRRAFVGGGKLIGMVDKRVKVRDLHKGKECEIVPIEEGQKFELGNREVSVVFTPGHTVGSITLLDDKTMTAFSGDETNPLTLLALPFSTSVERWLEGAKRIRDLANTYAVRCSHEDGRVSKEMLDQLIATGEDAMKKYGRNRIFSSIVLMPKENKENGMIVFRTGHLYDKKREKRVVE